MNSFNNGVDSLVVGINGKWGTGKSTFIDYIKQALVQEHTKQKKRNYVKIDFNPWVYSGQKELQGLFFNELNNQIPLKYGDLKKLLKGLAKKIEYLSFLKYANPTVKNGIDSLNSFLSNFDKETTLINNRIQIDDFLIKENLTLYIFIDDIDRLLPNEISQVLQLVKLNASFKNTIFILAYEKKFICDSLNGLYSNNGERYLEKIIQVEYNIPEIREDQAENFFFRLLGDFFKKNKIPFDEKKIFNLWQNHGLSYFLKTPRDVYRIINGLQIRLPIIYKEINIYDFIMLECLRLFEHIFYEEITIELGRDRFSRNFNRPPFISDKREIQDRKLICFNYLGLSNADISFEDDKRIADIAFTSRYFTLTLSPIDVAQEEFELFFNNGIERKKLLEDIYKFNRMKNFLRRLRVCKDGTNISFDLIKSFISYWNENTPGLNENYIEITDSIVNIIDISGNEKQIMVEFLDYLTYENPSFYLIQFSLLEFLITHFGTHSIGRSLYLKVKPIMKLNSEKIKLSFTQILNRWHGYIFNNLHKMESGKLEWLFVKRFSEFEPENYLIKLQFMCESDYKNVDADLLSIGNEVIQLDNDGGFYSFNEYLPKLIPLSFRLKYIERINIIEDSILTPRLKMIKRMFIENISEI